MTFESLIHPVIPSAFLSEYWDKAPVVMTRNAPDYYSDLFVKSDIERLIALSRMRYPEIRLVKRGAPMPADPLFKAGWLAPPGDNRPPQFTTLYEAYLQGHTIIVKADSSWPTISSLCRDIEEVFLFSCIAELYATPQRSQGFALHFDIHGVFVAQLDGYKEWELYRPVNLDADEMGDQIPLTLEQLEKRAGALELRVTLQPGDLLYIPRGFLHRATTAAGPSLHLSLGVTPFEWLDLVREIVTVAAANDTRFHDPLPPQFARQDPAAYEAKLSELLSSLAQAAERPAAALNRLNRRFISQLRPLIAGRLHDIDRLDAVTPDSIVIRNSGMICRYHAGEGYALLQFPGGQLKLPLHAAPVLDHLATLSDPIRISDLPGRIDQDSKLTLAKQLIKAGFLKVSSA